MHRIRLCLLLLTAVVFGACTNDNKPPRQLSKRKAEQHPVQQLVDQWANSAFPAFSSVGVSVRVAESGMILGNHDGHKSLIPASNLKLLTTASALAMIGPEFRYTTVLAYDGELDKRGVLRGNVYVIGSGDPTLGSPRMPGVADAAAIVADFRRAIDRAGISRIEGRIIGHDTAFPTSGAGSHWPWLDLGNYYGAGAYGLNYHDNLYYLNLAQAKEPGQRPSIASTRPSLPDMDFHNELVSGPPGSGDDAYIYAAPYNYTAFVRGSIPAGSGTFTIRGALPDPALLLAENLHKLLERTDIKVAKAPTTSRLLGRTSVPGGLDTLGTFDSPPLTEIINRVNMESMNMYAEALLYTIGHVQKGEADARTALDALKAYWMQQGMSFEGVHLYDGSGLGARNVVPAHFITHLLWLMYRDDYVREPFYNSLPLAGRSGSLRNAMKGTTAEGILRAKSGSLEYVRAYSGYVPARNGTMLAFSVLVNNYDDSVSNATSAIFAFLNQLAELEW